LQRIHPVKPRLFPKREARLWRVSVSASAPERRIAQSYTFTGCHTYAYADSNRNCNVNTDGHGYRNTRAVVNADAYSYGHADPHRDCHAEAYA
jgi:hypothetical protein